MLESGVSEAIFSYHLQLATVFFISTQTAEISTLTVPTHTLRYVDTLF